MVNNIQTTEMENNEETNNLESVIYDAGNGQSTVVVNGEIINLNTGIRTGSLSDITWSASEALEEGVINRLYTTIISNSLVGEYVQVLALGEQIFNGDSKADLTSPEKGKTNSPEPLIILFSILAANKIQKEYEKSGSIKNIVGQRLEMTVDMVTVLPETEAKAVNRETYKKRFLNGVHSVQVHLSQNELATVEIQFAEVEVKSEGAMGLAGIALDDKGKSNTDDGLFGEFKQKYNLDSFVGTDLLTAPEHVILIDVGEGTTEIHPIKGMKVLSDKSEGIRIGSATAYDAAAEQLIEEFSLTPKDGELDRRDITKLITNKYYPRREEMVKFIEDKYTFSPVKKIAKLYEKVAKKIGDEVSYVVVQGGGSIIMRKHLEKLLDEAVKARGTAKVLYVPTEYAQKVFIRGMILYKATRDQNRKNKQ